MRTAKPSPVEEDGVAAVIVGIHSLGVFIGLIVRPALALAIAIMNGNASPNGCEI